MQPFKSIIFVLFFVGTTVLPAAATASSRPIKRHNIDPVTAAVTDFADLFYTKKQLVKAFEKYVTKDYIQHNPSILDGRDAAIAYLTPLWSSSANSFEIKKIIVGKDSKAKTMATIHLKATIGAGNLSVVDIYRLEGKKVVEHWDVMQAMDPAAVNPKAYF